MGVKSRGLLKEYLMVVAPSCSDKSYRAGCVLITPKFSSLLKFSFIRLGIIFGLHKHLYFSSQTLNTAKTKKQTKHLFLICFVIFDFPRACTVLGTH